MKVEPSELTEARRLLKRFQTDMHRPEGIRPLSEALLLLSEIRCDGEPAARKIASNLSKLYAEDVQAQVELLLSTEPLVHSETVDHWQKVFGEFESAGFPLSRDQAKTRFKLTMKMMNREIDLLSRTE